MKRWIYASEKERTIDIVVEFDPVESIESTTVEYRPNMTPDHQYTEDQLQWYNDLIDNVIDLVEDYAGFNIEESYQSSESYSYYIKFEAFTKDGESLGDFRIKIRIADHLEPAKQKAKNKHSNNNSASNQIANKGNKRLTIFRTLKINEVAQSGLVAVIQTMQRICDGLLEGDVSVLDELTR